MSSKNTQSKSLSCPSSFKATFSSIWRLWWTFSLETGKFFLLGPNFSGGGLSAQSDSALPLWLRAWMREPCKTLAVRLSEFWNIKSSLSISVSWSRIAEHASGCWCIWINRGRWLIMQLMPKYLLVVVFKWCMYCCGFLKIKSEAQTMFT